MKLLWLGWLVCCLAACSSPAPSRPEAASPLAPQRVKAICDAAVEGKVPGNLLLPASAAAPLPEEGEFVVVSEPRGCECVLKLRAYVITSKQFKCL